MGSFCQKVVLYTIKSYTYERPAPGSPSQRKACFGTRLHEFEGTLLYVLTSEDIGLLIINRDVINNGKRCIFVKK